MSCSRDTLNGRGRFHPVVRGIHIAHRVRCTLTRKIRVLFLMVLLFLRRQKTSNFRLRKPRQSCNFFRLALHCALSCGYYAYCIYRTQSKWCFGFCPSFSQPGVCGRTASVSNMNAQLLLISSQIFLMKKCESSSSC